MYTPRRTAPNPTLLPGPPDTDTLNLQGPHNVFGAATGGPAFVYIFIFLQV